MNELEVSGVYKIINTITNECYVGSSKNIYKRWYTHRAPSTWDKKPNIHLYQDMRKYGVDKFRIQILVPVMEEHLRQVEQELIEMIQPAYNNNRANGLDIEKHKESIRKWHQSSKYKEYQNDYNKNYGGQICEYKGETLTLKALLRRFQRAGVEHPAIEANKYLITTIQQYS